MPSRHAARRIWGSNPKEDGDLVAAERLGLREGPWESVWRRFAEAPAAVSRRFGSVANGDAERPVRRALFLAPRQTRREKPICSVPFSHWEAGRALVHGNGSSSLSSSTAARRDWVWAKLGQTPLADALAHLAVLAERTSNDLGGVSPAEMAKLYANGAWEIDAAAALSSMGRGEVVPWIPGR